MPTMAGAFAYDLYKNLGQMTGHNTVVVAAGFVTAFVAGWFVVKGLLAYVSRHGFALFAYWRLVVGGVGLAALIAGV